MVEQLPELENGVTVPRQVSEPAILCLTIERFRGIEALRWCPRHGLNLILGGGDVGKTTILDAIALLLSPSYSTAATDTEYLAREVGNGFVIEAVMVLPPESGIDYQFKPSWPWEWNGKEAIVPSLDADSQMAGEPVYRLRVRGTEDHELVYEIMQPDGATDNLTAGLRRSIGLVRLGGDEQNDSELRLVQGSALDRLLSDKALRSRMATALAVGQIEEHLVGEKRQALSALDKAFKEQELPHGLALSMVGGRSASIASMVGLTAKLGGVSLPLASWGAGTRRLSALAIAEQDQERAPITVIDEIERGLEPYRQSVLVEKIQSQGAQAFATTHSPFVIAAASSAAIWYVDHERRIGLLDGKKVQKARGADPEVFLSRLAVITEGKTEVGFVNALLERAVRGSLATYGIHVCDGGGNESTLELLEALSAGGLLFAGFADDEGKHPTRWHDVAEALGPLLFRWPQGCTEENILAATPDDKLEALLTDPNGDKTGVRLRTLADRLGADDKDFATLSAMGGSRLRELILEAACGDVPSDKVADRSEAKQYKRHAQDWFKTTAGGQELVEKVFSLELWPKLKEQLLPFCNAVRAAIDLEEIEDLAP